MPAANPKLQVILPKDVMATIAALAKLQGRSRSAVARDFLVQVAPILARVANTLQAAQTMDMTGRAKLLANLEAVQEAVEGDARQLLLTLERAMETPPRRPTRALSRVAATRTRGRRRSPQPPVQ